MKKRTRVLVITAGLFLALIAIGIASLPALVTLDDVKGQVTDTLSRATGRTVTIHGLGVSLFPWLGIRLDGAALGNAPGFGRTPLARIAHVRIEVRVLPLLRRHIVLRRVVLTGLRLNLEENGAGVTNWAALTQGASPAPKTPAAARAEAREAPAFTLLRVAGLTVRHADIRYRNARTGSRDTLADLGLRLGAIAPGRPVAVEAHARIETAGHLPLPLRLAARATYSASGLTLSALRLQAADLVAHGHLAVLRTAAGIRASGDLAVPAFAPRPLLAVLGIHYAPRDTHVLRQASADIGFHWDPAVLRLAPLRLTLDHTTMTGTITRTARPLFYTLHLSVDHLRPLTYLPAPAPAAPHAAPAAAHAAALSPAALNTPLVADIACGRLRVHGLVATQVSAHIRARAGHVLVRPLRMTLYQGRLVGSAAATLGTAPRAWRVHARLHGVQVSALLRALHLFPEFSGALDAGLHLRGSGTTLAAAESSATGRLAASMAHGTMRGVDLDLIAKDPRALVGAHNAKLTQGTAFSRLHASATVAHGVVSMNTVVLHIARAVIHGHGRVTLATKSIDYLLAVALPSGFVIPVRIQGPAGHIRFSVSLNRLFSDSSPNSVGTTLRALGGVLQHALGGH